MNLHPLFKMLIKKKFHYKLIFFKYILFEIQYLRILFINRYVLAFIKYKLLFYGKT